MVESIEFDLIICGSGLAGLRAAIELADMGTNVYLIEKDFFVGGRIPQMQELFQTDEKGKEIVEKLFNEIKKRANITIFTGAEFESISGNVGNFDIKIKIKPRYIIPDCNKKRLNEIIDKCTNETSDEFNFGLTKRKAIYKNYENALPDIPVIDKDLFNQKESFLKEYKDCINLDQKTETLNFNVGAIIICFDFLLVVIV